jgi:hypothetical protein
MPAPRHNLAETPGMFRNRMLKHQYPHGALNSSFSPLIIAKKKIFVKLVELRLIFLSSHGALVYAPAQRQIHAE